MSNKAQAVISDRVIEPRRKLMLLKFAECGNDEGESIYPKSHNVYRRCSIARSTYRKFLGEFKAAGILEPDTKDDAKGGRGKGRAWRLNLTRVRQLYPSVVGMDEEAYKSALAAMRGSTGAGCAAADAEAGDDGETVHPGGPFGGNGKGPPGNGKGPPENAKGSTSVDPINPLNKSNKENPCAAGAAPEGAPATQGEDQPLRENRHWKPARDYFVALRSEGEARAWWDILIALKHDADGTLVLGAPTGFLARMIMEKFSLTMGAALKRAGDPVGRIRVVESDIAAKADRKRKAMADAEKQQPRRAR